MKQWVQGGKNSKGLGFVQLCQYATTNNKVYKGLKHVFIKFAQSNLQKIYYLVKKNDKMKQ